MGNLALINSCNQLTISNIHKMSTRFRCPLHNSKVVLKSIVFSAGDVIVAGGEFAFLALLCEIHNDYI